MRLLQPITLVMLFFLTTAAWARDPALRPWYRESPSARERRTLHSPSLYASPYPAGGLYTWRQYYYDRFRDPYFGQRRHPVFERMPFSRELSATKSWMSPEAYAGLHASPEDPITRLQREAFTDDAHTAEQLLELRLGY